MSQISIGLRGQAPTAKKPNIKNEESIRIRGSAISHIASLQDSDNNNIKRLKFWQLMQCFMLVTVFIIGITSLLLSIYVIIAIKHTQQREEMLAGIQELRAITHERRYQQLNNTVFTAVESVRNINLTAGCVQVQSTCIVNHNNINGFSSECETASHDVDVPGFRNINIFCNIDNSSGERNPIVSTLNIYSGRASCLCSLVALRTVTASPECRLTIQRCPETI
jgi:hypothetical protein